MATLSHLGNRATADANVKTPKIGVIVPTYNRLTTLPRAIDSVLSQSYKNFELWIVDDGSSDGTADWARDHLLNRSTDIPIHFIQTEQKGVSHARNVAIRASTSEWLAFLDSDDEWLLDKLEVQMQFADDHPEYPLIHGEEIWVRNGVRVNPMKKYQKSGGRILKNCVSICCISPSTTIVRRSLFDEVGLFREDFPVCEDYDLWLRVTSRFEVGFIESPVIFKYGGHEDQLSRTFKAMDYYRLKALQGVVESPSLSGDERIFAREIMRKKCEILLRGFERHDNWTHFDEVKSIAADVD